MAFAFPLAFKDVPVYTYSDYIIDMCFIFDIIVNFRSCYFDPRTDDLVDDPRKITTNYLKGRFWVDLIASCNFDLIFLILAPDMGDNAVTSLFGMPATYGTTKVGLQLPATISASLRYNGG